eukprot:3453710-Alexandrium_andersonii.AAC.1
MSCATRDECAVLLRPCSYRTPGLRTSHPVISLPHQLCHARAILSRHNASLRRQGRSGLKGSPRSRASREQLRLAPCPQDSGSG